jgi:O-antigen/teichoic acid export membrane protein
VEGIHSVSEDRGFYDSSLRGLAKKYLLQMIASDFVRKVAETFATRIFLIGIGLVTTVFVARMLGPEGRGLYAVAGMVGAIGVQFGNLGLHASNTYYVAQNRNLLPTLLCNTLLVSFVIGGFVSAIAWCVFTLWPSLSPIRGVLSTMALIWIPIGLAYLLVQNLLIGINEIGAYNTIEIVTKIVGLGLISIVILADSVSVEIFFLMSLVSLIISLFWGLKKLKQHLKIFPKPSLKIFKENIRYGIKAYLAGLFSFMVLRSDLLMVKYLIGDEQAGYYSIAATMADMVYMLPVIVGTILFPKLSAISDPVTKWHIARKIATIVAFIMIFFTYVSVLLAEPIIQVMFGKEFIPSAPAFVWLMPGIIMLSINTILMNYFASLGMPSIAVYSPGFAFIINLFLNYKMIPLLGIIGASIASVISYGIMLLFSLIYLYRRRIDFADQLS